MPIYSSSGVSVLLISFNIVQLMLVSFI